MSGNLIHFDDKASSSYTSPSTLTRRIRPDKVWPRTTKMSPEIRIESARQRGKELVCGPRQPAVDRLQHGRGVQPLPEPGKSQRQPAHPVVACLFNASWGVERLYPLLEGWEITRPSSDCNMSAMSPPCSRSTMRASSFRGSCSLKRTWWRILRNCVLAFPQQIPSRT